MDALSTTDRRMFVAGLAGIGILISRPGLAQTGADRLYVNAYGSPQGFGLAAFAADGGLRYTLPLPQRGHSFTHSPDGRTGVAYARRPGSFALVFELASGRVRHRIAAADDRNFCGHGAYTADGRLMFATEVVASAGDGVLGVYDVRDGYRRVGEYATHGLDPHEMLLMPDRRTLVVANGGILMRSDMPRLKLNIPDMAPSLVYIDSRDGSLLAKVTPAAELHQLSTRHIAIDRRGRVAVAMQYEGPESDDVPLVALHDPAGRAEFGYLPMPAAEKVALKQYCGSAAIDRTGRYLAVSSPRGNRVLVWDLAQDTMPMIASVPLDDVCGLGASGEPGGFMLSAGTGEREIWMRGSERPQMLAGVDHGLQWDNHMMPVAI
jgi:hypothetical protein